MKNLHRIIILFITILAIGIFVIVKTINAPLNTPQETVEIQKDTLKYSRVL